VQAIDGAAVEVGVQAPNVDELTFAGIRDQRDAGDAREGVGDVDVGVFGDLALRLDADDVGGKFFQRLGLTEAAGAAGATAGAGLRAAGGDGAEVEFDRGIAGGVAWRGLRRRGEPAGDSECAGRA